MPIWNWGILVALCLCHVDMILFRCPCCHSIIEWKHITDLMFFLLFRHFLANRRQSFSLYHRDCQELELPGHGYRFNIFPEELFLVHFSGLFPNPVHFPKLKNCARLGKNLWRSLILAFAFCSKNFVFWSQFNLLLDKPQEALFLGFLEFLCCSSKLWYQIGGHL